MSSVKAGGSPPRMTIDDIYAQMDRDGKQVEPIPMSTFLPVALVGVPLWLVTVLPLTVSYQLAMAITKSLSTSSKQDDVTPAVIPEIEIPSNVIPRKDRKYDVVLLGATGFTGKLATMHVAKTYGVGKKVKWAIAGRSQAKLDTVKSDTAQKLGEDAVLSLDTLLVDTNDLSTLPTLVRDTRCVITTAGPFQKYGSNVVEYCAKYGTHYVDITGEVDWVKTMILKWDDTAKQTGAKIVPLCGHDSVPWDLTVLKLSQILRTEKGEELENASCYDEVVGSVSGGTVATALVALDGTAVMAPKHEFDPLLKTPDGTKSPNRTKDVSPALIQKCSRPGRFFTSWTMPFVMTAVNVALVKRSNAITPNGSSSLSYFEVSVVPDFKTAFVNVFGLLAGVTALMNPITKPIVKRFLPSPGEGPSEKEMDGNFLCITGEGVGSKGGRAETAMYFPTDVGYRETARMVTESGLCLALDDDKLPANSGGFWTPATGMGDVLLGRLCRTGTSFACRIMATTENE